MKLPPCFRLILWALVFTPSLFTRAANLPPERFLAFPDLTLTRGATSAPIPLADHLRDPDVPGTAARITVRLAGQTRTIDLALHDAEAPLTVANFVAYVNAGRYADNFFHRSIPGFIIQNGGFNFLNDTTFDQVPTYPAVKNEPGRSNLRGTVAMAKLGGDPDSATSQWFINLADNSANLDAQNGGFTVFAHVLGDGIKVADAIAATPRYDASGLDSAWTDLPLSTGVLARANFIETDAAIVPALSHVVTSDDPGLVSATIENGALRLTVSTTRSGTTTIRLVTTDLEGGRLESSLSLAVYDTKPAISAGYDHSLFLKTDGTVWATGWNIYGQLGDGSTTNRSTLVQVMSGVSAISAGYYHSLFLKTDGTVWATGYNYYGQLGDGSTSSQSTPVQVLSGVSAISAGYFHSLFLKTDGTVWATGSNNYGQLGDGSTTDRSTPVRIKYSQTIAFTPPASATFGDAPLTLSATATTGLPVSLTVASGPATISGNLLTLTGAGSVVIRATQAGDAEYYAAPGIENTITVAKAGQTIAFTPPASAKLGESPLNLSASATSGLKVGFTVVSGPATVFGNQLTLTGAGSVVIRATQPGDNNYNAATSVERTITISPISSPQTISFTPPASATFGDAPLTLSATATSGLPVAFILVSGPAILSGSTLTLTGAGSVVVRATQAGDNNTNAAPALERTLTISQIANAQITLQPRTATYTGAPQPALATTTPAGLRVTYTYKLGSAAAVASAPTLPGTYTVTATLDDPSASNKPTASATLTINKAPLTISARNVSRAVGIANPVFSLSYSGFVGADTPATALTKIPVAATKATASGAPGTYPITLTGGVSNNYTLTLVPGTLTVVGFGGTYEALLFDAAAIPVGKLTLTIPANALSYTGTLALARETSSVTLASTSKAAGTTVFVGSTDLANASATWTRTTNGLDALSLALTVSADGTLTGNLNRNGQPFATLAHGARQRVFTTGQTAPGAGANTLVLHPAYNRSDAAPSSFPRGSGFATAPIAAATGVMTLTGTTADGSPLTASLKPTVDDTYLLWVNPYGTRADSFLAGALPLEAHPETTRFPGRAYIPRETGLLTWKKAALPANTAVAKLDKSYRAGFGPLGVEVSLDPWLPPATTVSGTTPAGTLAQRLGLAANATASGALTIAHGPDDLDLGARESLLPIAATVNAAGVFSATNAAATAWTVKITPATGAFTGSFTLRDPAPTPAKPSATADRQVSFSGVLRQAPTADRQVGAGFFLVPGFAVPKGSAPTEQPSGEIRFSNANTVNTN